MRVHQLYLSTQLLCVVGSGKLPLCVVGSGKHPMTYPLDVSTRQILLSDLDTTVTQAPVLMNAAKLSQLKLSCCSALEADALNCPRRL